MRSFFFFFLPNSEARLSPLKNSLLFCLACFRVPSSFWLLPVSLVVPCQGMNIWPWITCLSKSIWNLVKGVSSLRRVRSHQERHCVLISSSAEMFFQATLGLRQESWPINDWLYLQKSKKVSLHYCSFGITIIGWLDDVAKSWWENDHCFNTQSCHWGDRTEGGHLYFSHWLASACTLGMILMPALASAQPSGWH